ncbi:MAG: ribonuclease HII [Alphaproteobacteria bacterium]|nr:ribonuclease HII [Alphaproteobacteria bacterium]
MPSLKLERACGVVPVCGIDEAGRGPLAGPVVAAAVVLDPGKPVPRGIDDSKKLDRATREALAAKIQARAFVGVGQASVAEIDRFNILRASLLAMCRAVEQLTQVLGRAPAMALVDGNIAPPLDVCPVRTVVGGDALSLSIAAASIVAKVTRDRLMTALAREHPHYGWEHNAGYGTQEHLAALGRHGPTPYHRSSFRPVAQLSLIGET